MLPCGDVSSVELVWMTSIVCKLIRLPPKYSGRCCLLSGEVGIKNIELFAQGTSEDNEIFGYQEKDYEYRYSKNIITGEFSPDYAQSLDSWHYGDDYSELPTLSQEWITADKSNVDRTIAITGQDQFLCDFYFYEEWTRPMPMHGVPGLIDHF